MPAFAISHDPVGGDVDLLKVSGFLDAHTVEQLEEFINNLFSQGRFKLVIDLAGVGYISSAGAGVFIAALSESEENGGKIVLLNPTKTVMDVFDLLGLTQIFTVANERQEAVDALSG
ncbi:MAG: STAS domain-containing protein [Planctomycetota bacterium]|jgi:anti-sigma B factor antagonist